MEETNFLRHETIEVISDEYRNPEKTALPIFDKTKTCWDKMKLFQLADLQKPNEIKGMMLRPLVFSTFPVIFFCGFTYGFNLAWLAVLNATTSLILGDEPHNFSAPVVGLSYISPLTGVALGSAVCGYFGDKFVLRRAEKHNGIMESEYRLWLFLPCLALLPGGLALWGIGGANNVHFMGILFAMGIIAFTNTL